MKRFLKHLHMKGMVKPVLWATAFSILYSLCYIFSIAYLTGTGQVLVALILPGFYAYSWYWICLKLWNRPWELTLNAFWKIYLWVLAVHVISVYGLMPWAKSAAVAQDVFSTMGLQMIGSIFLVLYIPLTVLMFKGLSQGIKKIKALAAYMLKGLFDHSAKMILSWLLIFIVVSSVSTALAGPLSLAYGFYTVPIFNNLLNAGTPFAAPLVIIASMGANISNTLITFGILGFLFAIVETWGLVNWLKWAGELKDSA